MSTNRFAVAVAPHSVVERDLGPLAWVLEEVRKALEGAVKAARIFVREAQVASQADLTEGLTKLESSPLRIAKQHLHQACGALEMVEMPHAALLLHAMETAVKHYVQNPADCTEAVVETLESASFAVLEFLEAVLVGKPVVAVGLFPQYRDVQALYDAKNKVYPADLWHMEPHGGDLDLGVPCAPLAYDVQQRTIMDTAVLRIVRGEDVVQASACIRDVCLGYAQAQTEVGLRIFWKVAAGYFDALAHGLVKIDIYAKRVTSRVLMMSVALAKGIEVETERLLQDMLFFCAQVQGDAQGTKDAVIWRGVYDAFDLQRHTPVDYETVRFGRFEPAALDQMRKRIAAATELWAALAGGDVQKVTAVVDQFALVGESLQKLMPGGQALAQALTQVLSRIALHRAPPEPEVAMEVATAVLYLQAAFTSLDMGDEEMSAHAATLAQRLMGVQDGLVPQPLEPWMEKLYRQVSERQTMGSVVGELRATLAETEQWLDQYFRCPSDTSMLHAVATNLTKMRGVLSVLGFEPASQAMVRMRQYVERLQAEHLPEGEQHVLFDKIGNSLGVLGFLIDMLGYQRHIARKLYVFDEHEGELKLLMGRLHQGEAIRVNFAEKVLQAREEEVALSDRLEDPSAAASAPEKVTLVPQAAVEPSVQQLVWTPEAGAAASPESVAVFELFEEDSDDDLLEIFLQEAREVVVNARVALQTLSQDPANWEAQTALRRAFHTLKGSSRMVGLNELGQAGWAMEQMLNAWLAEHQAMPDPMRQLAGQALDGFEAWVAAMAAHAPEAWQAAPFCRSADAMRLQGAFIPLELPIASTAPESGAAAAEEVEEALLSPSTELKTVGDLSVPLPLFNIYLSEAEEWSAQLLEVLTTWHSAPEEAQPKMAHIWAHSLAGSSATVGFVALSELARKLEDALLYVLQKPHGVQAQVQVFVHAAEDIRAMLHQFAAGYLPVASEQVYQQLQQILAGEVMAQADQPVPAAAVHASIDREMTSFAVASAIEPSLDAAALPESYDIEAVDAMDVDLFPLFEEEATELLPTMGAALREWCSHPQHAAARHTLLRALHTFKGSARLAGAMRLGEMAHQLESAVEALAQGAALPAVADPLFARLDVMAADFQRLRAQMNVEDVPQAVPQQWAQASDSQAPQTAHANWGVPQTAPKDFGWGSALPVVPIVQDEVRAAGGQTVRVQSQLLGRLTDEVAEVLIARSRLDTHVSGIQHSLQDLTSNLDKLRHQLRDMEVQTESQMQSRMHLAKESGENFDPLEFDRFTRVQELSRMMAESVNDVATVQRSLQRDVQAAEDDLIAQGRQARELQRDLLRTRMVGFDSIAERLHAVVRRTAKETEKQVKLVLVGGSIEMDRGVLERMVPAFEHLLRNCVDHGIEAPSLREQVGKPAAGVITVQVQHDGNDVVVSIQDDGAGLDVDRIREKALAQGMISPDEAVDAARAAQLIWMPGMTTAQQVTGVSGRGIGMDVVRSQVQSLGGHMDTDTKPGQGTVFRLVLPLTTAVTHVVLLRAGSFTVGVPVGLLEAVRRVRMVDLEAAYQAGELLEGDTCIPFFWAGAVWRQSPHSVQEKVGKTCPVVLIRSASQRVALHVDEVLGQQEVVVKPLGAQLSRLPGLTGVSLLASGAVLLIYNPVALTTVYGAPIRQLGMGMPAALNAHSSQPLPSAAVLNASATGSSVSHQQPLVMVVDDSITVRRVSQRLLQREGYRVITANDGLQALDKLQGEELPCVVLSDIEMPRMDGFDLLRNIRADERLQHLPVVMITSRIAQKHRDHAMELGANHYLGKPYSDEALMALVHHYALGQPLPDWQEDAGAGPGVQ